MRPASDMSLSIAWNCLSRDHNSSMTHILSKMLPYRWTWSKQHTVFDLADRRSMWLGQHIDRTGLQVVVWPWWSPRRSTPFQELPLSAEGNYWKMLDSSAIWHNSKYLVLGKHRNYQHQQQFGYIIVRLLDTRWNDTKTTLSLFE